MLIDTVIRTRPCHGEVDNGDAAIVHCVEGAVWVALADGLGHGREARVAAECVESAARRFDGSTSMVMALCQVHEALKGTRGAAATLVRFDERGGQFAGVGNVALRGLLGLRLPFAPVGGILGRQYRTPHVGRTQLEPGSRLLLMTDGVRRHTRLSELEHNSGQELCELLLTQHSHAHDDATAVHVEFLGKAGQA